VSRIESGRASSLVGYVRLALALKLTPAFDLVDRPKAVDGVRDPRRATDPVHAAMGDAEAAHLRALGIEVSLDEPYQHYQFAGRADLVGVDRGRAALLHLENKSGFPNLQDYAGSYNAKRAYLAEEVAERFGLRRFTSVTHVTVGLWSADVLHSLRVRTATFASVCPDDASAFAAWWSGSVGDILAGVTSSLVVLDPIALSGAAPEWLPFGDAVPPTLRPRYRGYADALDRLRAAGLA
jgi:hypothetical protein